MRGPRRPGCPRVRSAATAAARARRRGRGPRSLFSWRRHRLFFPNRKPDGGAWTIPPRPPEALPARLRGGQRGPAAPAAHSSRPARRRRPRPRATGRGSGGGGGGEGAGLFRAGGAPSATGRVGPTGWGHRGSAHLSRRGPLAPAAQAHSNPRATRTPLRNPHPEPARSPALTAAGEGGPAAPAPRRRSPSASLLVRPARLPPLWRWRGASRDFYPAGPPGSKRRRTQGSAPRGRQQRRRGLPEERTGVVRGPGALGDLREGLGAAARRHGGVTLSRAWVDRFWAALGGQWGQRGRCHLSRSVGLGAESWILPACALALHPMPRTPKNLSRSPSRPWGGRGWKSCRLGFCSVTSKHRSASAPSPHLPSAPHWGQKEIPPQKSKWDEGAAVYLGGFLPARWADKRKKRAFICPPHTPTKCHRQLW